MLGRIVLADGFPLAAWWRQIGLHDFVQPGRWKWVSWCGTPMDWRRPTVEYSLAAANPLLVHGQTIRGSPERLGFSGRVCATKQTLPTITNLMGYLCETTSIEGFVQLLACNYLPHGYWFYVTGHVPEGKNPQEVDAKLIGKYGIDLPRATKSRRKRLGNANMQYLRHGRVFVLLATQGKQGFLTRKRLAFAMFAVCR